MNAPAGLADLHSHLVPGVDDGARTVADALEGIGRMVESGVTSVITTPHFDASLQRDPHRFAERMERIDEAFESLAGQVHERFPELTLGRGHEIMLDDPFPDLSDPRLRLAGTRFVLLEWPRLRVPPSTPEVIAHIREQGWVPLIAHPERYHAILQNFPVVSAWRRAGAYLQMNHGSIMGRYGDDVRTAALRLLEGGWVDVLSSDFHGRSHIPIFISEARDWFEEQSAMEAFELLTELNPGRILTDELLEPVPSFPIERGFWDRLTGFLRPGDA